MVGMFVSDLTRFVYTLIYVWVQ